ncbi:hypothetical protein DRA43_05740 [Micromonospora provocatoris]|nr:hypothetical protein [Micromonospora provocatoris]RBJ08789.1 hypothetical protein DRA43_05740 [Micromonospora provocatoris]
MAAVGTALGLGIMMTLPGVAQADSGCQFQGSDRACFINNSSGASLEVCDNEADGNGVYAIFYTMYVQYEIKVGDGNGSASPCGTRQWSHGVNHFKICEDDAGEDSCTWWSR